VRALVGLAALTIAAGAYLSQGSALAEPSTLIAYADDSGTRDLGSGFDSGVPKPKKMVLKVKVDPNVRIELEYQVACRGNGDREVLNKERRTRSRRIPLPLLVERPAGCLVYAFGSFDGPSQREVSFRIELRAKSRGYQPPPPEPIAPEDVRARLKVEPRVVSAPRRITVRAIGRDARRFITGLDLRLDRPTSDGGWEPAYLVFAHTSGGRPSDPVALPPSEPIGIAAIGFDPRAKRIASLDGVAPGAYRLRMKMSPTERDTGLPDNVRLYRELTVQAVE
jgi:hypothetical protein